MGTAYSQVSLKIDEGTGKEESKTQRDTRL